MNTTKQKPKTPPTRKTKKTESWSTFLVRYATYLFRWQCSTPILAGVIIIMSDYSDWLGAMVANLIGGLIFFWVDRVIFTWKRK